MWLEINELVTAEKLARARACDAAVREWDEAFPNGLKFNKRNFKKLYSGRGPFTSFPWVYSHFDWLIRQILTVYQYHRWELRDAKFARTLGPWLPGKTLYESDTPNPEYVSQTIDYFFELYYEQRAEMREIAAIVMEGDE